MPIKLIGLDKVKESLKKITITEKMVKNYKKHVMMITTVMKTNLERMLKAI